MSIYSYIQVNNIKMTQKFLTGRTIYEGRSAPEIKEAVGGRGRGEGEEEDH
jgi:hypothetical protein